jgi:hypothetical protein
MTPREEVVQLFEEKRLASGQDPAPSSSIILTTVTDVVGFMSFLGLATVLSTVLAIG